MSMSRRICLVTRDIIGPIKNGGIGTAFYHLARFLAQSGHQVTILYTLGEHSENEPISHWVEHYKQFQVTFIPLTLEDCTQPIASVAMRTSLCVYRWLKEHSFDIVHFHEWHGVGYYSLLAKMEGLAFANTLFYVQLHSPTIWHQIHDARLVTSFDIVELDYLERRSVELADILISPSQYMVGWCRSQGWKLPQKVEILPNLLGGVPTEVTYKKRPCLELVFFGRLEWRKGLVLFCQALQRLPADLQQKIKVTFLGKESTILGMPAQRCIDKAMERLPGIAWEVISDKDSLGALNYLKSEGRVAVVASLVENSPYTVLECLAAGIPLLAADAGGIPELIADADKAMSCFSLEPGALADRIMESVRHGLAPCHPAHSWERVREQWSALHTAPVVSDRRTEASGQPLVSVCVTHFNRPAMLRRTLEGIAAQDYPHLEVIVVDDGSTDSEARKEYDTIERAFSDRGWIFLKQTNRYLGAARNFASNHATGEYLLFMDDDNYAKPDEVSRFVQVAQHTGADILTCAVEYFTDDAELMDALRVPKIQIPLGASLGGGMYENVFGDANALIRTSVFRVLGGFTEVFGVGLEDFEFFAKAVAKGYRLEVIPEALFCYRQNASGMLLSTGRIQNALRAVRPYLENYPELAPGVLLAQGYHYQLPEVALNWARVQQELTAVNQEREALLHQRKEMEEQMHLMRTRIEAAGDELLILVTKCRQYAFLRRMLDFKVRLLLKLCQLLGWLKRNL